MTDISGKTMRRMTDNVLISGTAVLLLGAWSSIKFCVSVFVHRSELLDSVRGNEDVTMLQLFIVTVLMTLFFATGSMLVHIYIGVSARALALDRKRKPPFLILSCVLLFITVNSALYSLLYLFDEGNEDAERASLIIDLTLVFALLNLIASARKLRKIRKESPADSQGKDELSQPETV